MIGDKRIVRAPLVGVSHVVEGVSEEMASLEQLEALRVSIEQRMVVHEEATVKLQDEMAQAAAKAVKNSQEQAEIIKDLRGALHRAQEVASVFADRTKGTPVGEDGTPDWKRKFDLDARPKELRDGGVGFTEWRVKFERYIGSGDRKLLEALKISEKQKTTIHLEELKEIADQIDIEFEILETWDYKIQTAIMSSVTGENHIRVSNDIMAV